MSGELIEKAKKAKKAASKLVLNTTEEKNQALRMMSAQLIEEQSYILSENKKDLEAGREKGIGESLLDRLRLTEGRIHDMADALLELTELQDPIGEVVEEWERPNQLNIQKIRVPLGVIGMIYEARPNVTVDASSLCLKAGNAVMLRGSSSAIYSNKALVAVLHRAIEQTALPVDSIQLLEDTSRETASKMLKLNDYLDVLIPRGGANLIKTVVENSSVPVLETGAGNCHVYIDESADKKMAIDIAVNAKTQRPSVCNACETILVQKEWAANYLEELVASLNEKGVIIHGDETVQKVDKKVVAATEEDWATEYLDLEVAIKIVKDVHKAIEHITMYSTGHSEAIISNTQENVDHFFKTVDAAALYHNASTRFTDGFEFGFGAEIGISTQKLHARGPMGLPALTSTKYLLRGDGQLK